MKFLTPLGLLGLLGILVLILIYIIKPNYQQKLVSSTFIWKLSLKYKKKRIPTSKLRDIILIICQIMVLAGCAAALASPVQVLREQPKDGEVIAIIDSSASMRTVSGDTTRFDRAVSKVTDLVETTLYNQGTVSLILADQSPDFLVKKATYDERARLDEAIGELSADNSYCSYGSSDIQAAMELCEDMVAENPNTKIYLFTDSVYSYVPDNVEVVNVFNKEEEWNAAILDATASFESGYYKITVKVACYGNNRPVRVNLDVMGANAVDINNPGVSRSFYHDVECNNDEVETLIFGISDDTSSIPESELEHTTFHLFDDAEKFYSFQSILLSIDEVDSFSDDNTFSIYGGQKEVLRIQYATSLKNPFVQAALLAIQKQYANQWDIKLSMVTAPDYETKGFDLYVFEHAMPDELPKDGAVILLDPLTAPNGSGLVCRSTIDFKKNLTGLIEETNDEEERHSVLTGVTVSEIEISRYTRIDVSDNYTTLMSCAGDPVFMIRDDDDGKVAVMAFSLHYSNLPLLSYWPRLMRNTFEFFLPSTVVGNSFEVGEEITLNSRGSQIEIKAESGGDYSEKINKFPGSVTLNIPGTYRITQSGYMDKSAPDIQIYVKIPAVESNIYTLEDALYDPFNQENHYDYFKDLLFYLAAAIVALLFIEWILQLRDNM